ncbi:hypothetical protein BCR36DRAFT_415077 [Piromyces finnis]|uniref:RIIa domain-containing protein n=1 Tax=Piromyces finnis TaxID=1754191 RepID=A0A1Y1V1C9_9FUNG|nr:hypothetical protein BCR36DRAFT_415077 [Piromyces finnis]|eukprot:ORX44320.1 hypothetical protein BCR36DRAFT_415077 [Piromyces finnis]
MLSSNSLNSNNESYSSSIKSSSKQLNENNEELEYVKDSFIKSSSTINESVIDDNIINYEIQNSTRNIKSYSSKPSYTYSYSNERSNSEVSKPHISNKNSYIYDNEIVKIVNDQIRTSIDHHPDFLSNYLFTNKSIIGTNPYDAVNEPRFPKDEDIPVWKINKQLNEKTKIFLEALECYEPLSSIFTSEKLELNEKDSYGYYSIFIREVIYQNEPCYYICVDIKIYDRITSNVLLDKASIAYVTTTLHTLNQTTREYIGKCEDQNNMDHYILTKFRILNYKTKEQKIIYSIYDENYYKENTKTILAPHILTESGEEIVCRILGLILDENIKNSILNDTEFISFVNEELRITKFTLSLENKTFLNGLEIQKVKEIGEEIKFNKYLNKVNKLHEIEKLKNELEEIKLENSLNMSKSYDYLDFPKKINDLEIQIKEKQEQFDKEELQFDDEENYLNEFEHDNKNLITINNVGTIKKTYIPINKNKFFINITEEGINDQKENDVLKQSESSIFSNSNSESYSSNSNSINCEIPERTQSDFNTYNEKQYSKISDKDNNINDSNIYIDNDKLDKESLSSFEISDENQIKEEERIEKSLSNITELSKKNSTEKIKYSLINMNTNSRDSIESIKEINNDIIKNQNIDILDITQHSTDLLESVPSKIESIENTVTQFDDVEFNNNISEKSNNSINHEKIENNDNSERLKSKYNSINNENNSSDNIKIFKTIKTTETSATVEITSNIESTETHTITKSENMKTITETTEKTSAYNISSIMKMETTTTIETSEIYNNNNINSRNNSSLEIINNKSNNNSLKSLKENINMVHTINSKISTEDINDNDKIKSINIENITDEDIEKEIMKMENDSSILLSTSTYNDISKELSSMNETMYNIPVSSINNVSNSVSNSVTNSVTNSVSSLTSSRTNSITSITTSSEKVDDNDDNDELIINPYIEEVKTLYGLEIPKSIMKPYVEYNYIHQKGYLQIYCSKMQVAFNNDTLNSKKNKEIKVEDSDLLNNPDVKSEYLTVKDKTKFQYTRYLSNNPKLKKIISDYLQLILSRKPNNIYEFTNDYFNSTTD